jgi:hypothetical protein
MVAGDIVLPHGDDLCQMHRATPDRLLDLLPAAEPVGDHECVRTR